MNMEINGVTLQADFMDADFMERFEPALYTMRDRINKVNTQSTQMVAAKLREMNQCMEDFFNAVWGPGTSDCIFNGSRNVMEHMEAVAQIDNAYKEERKQFNNFSNRYTQRQNNFQYMQGHQKKQKRRDNGG